ncbi:MAG TPA: hypothetical protein V6C90_27505, partial [Coleofasciculaceae cyanobacterium]
NAAIVPFHLVVHMKMSSRGTSNNRDTMINWQFRGATLPRPNPRLRERGWGNAGDFCSISRQGS